MSPTVVRLNKEIRKDAGMKLLHILVQRFGRCKRGATDVEYGLIAAAISITLMVSLATVGAEVNSTFSSIGKTLSGAQSN